MKIYADGCSWTEGAELPEDKKTQLRYASLVADSLDAQVVNMSGGGASNYRIMRQWMKYHNQKWDMAIIQLSIPSRTEFYLPDKGYQRIQMRPMKFGNRIKSPLLPKRVEEHSEKMRQYWDLHYRYIYTEQMGRNIERTAFYACKNTCIALGIPHLMLTINPDSELPFDLNLARMNLPVFTGHHPTEKGHRIIADKILELL